MDSKSFTFYSHNSMKDELVNLTEKQLNELRAFYVESYVDNMATKDLVQYVMDDMMQYMEALPDNEVVDECVNYWDDHFEDVVEEIKEYVDCKIFFYLTHFIMRVIFKLCHLYLHVNFIFFNRTKKLMYFVKDLSATSTHTLIFPT